MVNIELLKSHFPLEGVDQYGKTFTIKDTIGFSTRDSADGFNTWIKSYKDATGIFYPTPSEAVIIPVFYKNQFEGDTSTQVQVNYSALRYTPNTFSDYDPIAYHFEVEINGDGWYTGYFFLLPVDTASEYTYSTSLNVVIDYEGVVIAPEELINIKTYISCIDVDYFITPNIERELNNKLGELVDIVNTKGKDCDEYVKLMKSITLVESMLAGAYVRFNDNYMFKAQETVEHLSEIDIYND